MTERVQTGRERLWKRMHKEDSADAGGGGKDSEVKIEIMAEWTRHLPDISGA
jgi:hypothetical protein